MTYQDALIAIRDGQLPCRVCGKAHVFRPDPIGSWADPIDGHGYHALSEREFASQVLAQTE